jgi:hypothetical protein
MWRWLLRCLACLLLLGACFLSAARAGPLDGPIKDTPMTEEERERTPGLQIFLAFLSTVAVMVIVCMPARKRTV